jgi:predicted amidohydrolase YtcJ
MIRRLLAVCAVVCVSAATFSIQKHEKYFADASPMRRASKTADTSARPPADLVLVNGKIYTVDARHPWTSAVAIRGETILAMGDSEASVKSWIGPQTRVVDLHGMFAMPGFNDAHVHLAAAAYGKLTVNLEGAVSLAEFQARIRARLKDSKPGEWVTGRGWDHTLWPERKFPTRQDLDAISTDHPMIFGRVDGHVAVANSLALQIAGITRDTPDPPGGHIERDLKSGEPTGMLEEDAAMSLVNQRIPPYSAEQRRRAFEAVMNEALESGVTSIQDNSVRDVPQDDNYGWLNFLIYQQMQRMGALKIRITEWLPFFASLDRLEEMRRLGGATSPGNPGDPWLKTGALKALLDGSLGSRTAAMLTPYSDDPSTSGILTVDSAEITRKAIERDRAGFQIAFHAIGDRANRLALDVFAAVLAANGPRDRRDRDEHAQIVALTDLPRFGTLHVVASMQPSHLLDDERWADGRLGPERVKGAYAWQSMLKNGAPLAFGTDFPVESINPLRGLYACVTRELPGGGPPGGWHTEERLTIDDCLRAYTAGSAYAQFEEQRKGKIAPGMLADIVVFLADLTRIHASDLPLTPVEMTIAGGRIAYQRR